MAAVRPLVLVYQDFANVSTPVDLPDLNVLVVGPCYDVLDYPTDKDDILVGTVGSLATAPTGVAHVDVPVTGVVPGRRAGVVLDKTSLALYVDNAFAEVAFGNDGVIAADTNTLASAAGFAGVKVGDRVLVSDIDSGGGVVTVAKTVMAISADEKTLTLTSNFATSGKDVSGADFSAITLTTTGLKWSAQRAVSGATESTGAAALNPNVAVPTLAVTGLQIKVDGVAKKVTYGKVYAAFRALRTDLSSDIDTISKESDIEAKLGKIDERNPLATAAFVAFQNSNKQVQFLGVSSADLAGYTAARDVVSGRKDVYAIVPLTQDVPTITMWKNHCVALADPEIAKFRIVIGSGSLPTSKIIYPATGTQACTLEADSTGYFKLLDNVATFMTTGVAAGDLVAIGGSHFAVDSVLSENRLRLVGTSPGPGASTYAINRTLTRDQQVTELNAVTAGLKNSRCTMVWPDSCMVAGVKNELTGVQSAQPGYYVSAAIGGMVAGLPPHQGFTYIGIAGISQLFNSNTYFYDAHLDALSSGGWFVVVQDTPKSTPYSFHELTTDTTTLESGELMVVKNYDYVSMTYRDVVVGFLGVYNVTKETMDYLRAALSGASTRLQGRRYPKIGAPLISAQIDSVAALTNAKDQVDAYLSIEIPRVLNRVGLHIKA